MKIAREEYVAISNKAVQVIGREKILRMSSPQRGLLNQGLNGLLREHNGKAEQVPEAEIVGEYKMIVEHVLPTGSHEHLLK